jgi:hypothetical protein
MVDLPYASFRDDVILTTDANNALAMTVRVPGNVEASASEGDVWLTGTVGNRFERDAAEQAVAVLPGVRGIVDDIEIFSDIEAADVSDLVQGALDRYGVLPFDNDVQVQASDGTITLPAASSAGGEHARWRRRLAGRRLQDVRDDPRHRAD